MHFISLSFKNIVLTSDSVLVGQYITLFNVDGNSDKEEGFDRPPSSSSEESEEGEDLDDSDETLSNIISKLKSEGKACLIQLSVPNFTKFLKLHCTQPPFKLCQNVSSSNQNLLHNCHFTVISQNIVLIPKSIVSPKLCLVGCCYGKHSNLNMRFDKRLVQRGYRYP